MIDSATFLDQKSIQTIQNRGLRNSLRIRNPRDITQEELHLQCSIPTLEKRTDIQLLTFMYKLAQVPDTIIVSENPRTRGDNKVKFKTSRGKLYVVTNITYVKGGGSLEFFAIGHTRV